MKKLTSFQKKVARWFGVFDLDKQFLIGLGLLALSYPIYFIWPPVSLILIFAGFLVTVDFLLRRVP